MKTNSLKKEKNITVINFKNCKLRNDAKEYVRLYVEYNIETASIWSMDKVINDVEKKQFNDLIKKEMRKYGFRIPNEM